MEKKITMVHGSGGRATGELIGELFAKEFDNEILNQMEDSAVVDVTKKIAMTTDSFVVDPLFFPGGDIGRLCICGTVNDLLMRGAKPLYLTCGFILEEGLCYDELARSVHSMAQTAREAGVQIVAGDTKVVEGKGGMYINTAGVGVFENEWDISSKNVETQDAILVSGTLGDHHAAILGERLNIETDLVSDCAPLVEMTEKLLQSGISVHAMRDVTRGGLATVLKEIAQASGKRLELFEDKIPVTDKVRDFSGLLGLDPLYMGNEGKMVVFVPREEAKKAVEIMRNCRYGENTAVIGETVDGEDGRLVVRTSIGGFRELDILQGEGLPRIC